MEVVDAEPHHVAQFVMSDVRQVDIDEWVLGSGMRYQDILMERLDLETQYVRALLNDDGKCIALWGVVPEDGVGAVWLIASVEAETVGRRIHRFWPLEVSMMHMRHDNLAALAYAANELHLTWLQQIGFTATHRVLVGPGAVPFILHQRQQACVHH